MNYRNSESNDEPIWGLTELDPTAKPITAEKNAAIEAAIATEGDDPDSGQAAQLSDDEWRRGALAKYWREALRNAPDQREAATASLISAGCPAGVAAEIVPAVRVIVSRHPAAVVFIRQSAPEFADAIVIDGNATPADVAGKVVAGNLPLHLAALAAEVVAVEFDGAPPRGTEYGVAEMEASGARITRYRVSKA